MSRAATLPHHCSIAARAAPAAPLDTVFFSGPATAIGQFNCPVQHPAFRDSGAIERPIVVFPRTSVWIRHAGSRSFVADPNVVTIYNRAQRYERAPVSPDGDRCDWFAVSDDLAREIAGAFDPAASESASRAFRFENAPCTPALYLRQRCVLVRAAAGAADALETEGNVIGIVSEVMALAYRRAPVPLARRAAAARRRRDLVEQAKAELLRTVTDNRSVSDIARAVNTSEFHLCRIFRAATGRTLHGYRTGLRVRLALELLGDARAGASITDVAHHLGFASHAHLVHHCRRHLGATPSAVREQLRAAR